MIFRCVLGGSRWRRSLLRPSEKLEQVIARDIEKYAITIKARERVLSDR